jgi:type II secretory pathway pseudopilin PulG
LQLKKNPHHFLLIASILIPLVAQLFAGNTTTDIEFHDTYYILPSYFFTLFSFGFLFVFWLIYLVSKRYLRSTRLSWIHIVITILGIGLIAFLPFLFATQARADGHDLITQYNRLYKLTQIIVVVLLITAAGQLVYLANLFQGINYQKKSQAPAISSPTPAAPNNPLHLVPGKKYRVVKPFTDYDRVVHEIGESWTFVTTNFLPYEDGLTLHVKRDDYPREIIYRLQWRHEEQTAIIENFREYVEQLD